MIPKVGWVLKFWGVTFLVVPLKDKFACEFQTFWSVNIKSGFPLCNIWSFELKVMAKERSWVKFTIWFLNIEIEEHGSIDLWSKCATWHWKYLVKNYGFVIWTFWIKIHMEILWLFQSMGFITREFRNCTWELQNF